MKPLSLLSLYAVLLPSTLASDPWTPLNSGLRGLQDRVSDWLASSPVPDAARLARSQTDRHGGRYGSTDPAEPTELERQMYLQWVQDQAAGGGRGIYAQPYRTHQTEVVHPATGSSRGGGSPPSNAGPRPTGPSNPSAVDRDFRHTYMFQGYQDGRHTLGQDVFAKIPKEWNPIHPGLGEGSGSGSARFKAAVENEAGGSRQRGGGASRGGDGLGSRGGGGGGPVRPPPMDYKALVWPEEAGRESTAGSADAVGLPRQDSEQEWQEVRRKSRRSRNRKRG